MAMAGLKDCVKSGYVKPNTKLKVLKGPIFRQTKSSSSYWDEFFKINRKKKNIWTVQELIDYPDMEPPEWVFHKDKKTLTNCSHRVMQTLEGIQVPVYLICHIQE